MQFIRIFLIIIFYNFNVLAIPLNDVSYSFQYGKETTLEEACILAKEKLFDKARRKAAGGETISAESTKICKKSEEENMCNLFSNSFRSIAAIQVVDFVPIKFSDGNECKFSSLGKNIFEASRKGNFILKELPKPPDNFDFRISINKNEFVSYPVNKNIDKRKLNEILKISIDTMEDMYISVFQWWPYEDAYSIEKIFPNKHDTNNFFKTFVKRTIPTSEKMQNYSLRIDFPDEDVVNSNDVQEFLMVVGSREKINFLKSYSYTEFGEKLADIRYFRQHRKSYIIRKRTD